MRADRLLLQEKGAFEKIEAPCVYYGSCGGCSMQDLAYQDQLALKRQRTLRALGALDPSLTIDVVGMDDPWRYRNKAELTFGEARDRSPAAPGTIGEPRGVSLGYHAARSFWRVVDLDDCLLLPEPMAGVLRDMRELARSTGLCAYHPRSHQGFFRYLMIRASRATGQLMVSIVTAPGERALIDEIARELLARHPAIASLYWGISAKVADVAIPDELLLLHGSPLLDDQLGPFRIKLHPLNFLQPNPAQAERLYAQLVAWVSDLAAHQVAWDLYCGLGMVAFYLSAKCRQVYGIDIDARNLDLARQNALANGITNVEFRLGRAEDVLINKRFWLLEAKPDLIVVDPPRSGLHERVIATLLAARPKQLVYVSCNAQALARDLASLMRGFPRYRIRQAKAFDLFPHTNHLELLTLLERA